MKKIFVLGVIFLFMTGCGNNGNIIKNVDDLKVLHPQDFYELAIMFDELKYEYEAVFSSEKYEVLYTYKGEEELEGTTVKKLLFNLNGEEAIVYVNADGDEVKASHRGYTYNKEDDGLSFTLMEIKSKMPKIFTLSSEHITKRNRDTDTLINTESITIDGNKGTKEIYKDEHESSITGDSRLITKHLGIFDEFIIMLYEKAEQDDLPYEFKIISFKVK